MLPNKTYRSHEMPTNHTSSTQPTSKLKISKLLTLLSCMTQSQSSLEARNSMQGDVELAESQTLHPAWRHINRQIVMEQRSRAA